MLEDLCLDPPKNRLQTFNLYQEEERHPVFFLVVPVKPAPPFRHTLPSHHPGACQDRWSHFRKDHRFPVRWIHQTYLVGGIPWYTYPSEKYEFVSCEYYSQYMERKNNMFQTTKQF